MAIEIIIGLDGSVQPFGGFLTYDTEIPVTPEYRDYKITVPGKPGVVRFGQEPEERSLNLVISVQKPFAEQPAYLSQVANWLDPDQGEMLLKDERTPDRQLRVLYLGGGSYKAKFDQLTLSIPLVGRPFYESRDEYILSGSGTINSRGNKSTPCKIRFFGACSDPSITINGIVVSFAGSLSSGEYVEIDTENLTAKKVSGTTVTNILGSTSANFPWINPGSNTVTTSFNTAIYWRDRWLR